MVTMMEMAGYKMVMNKIHGLPSPFALRTPQGQEFAIPLGKQTSPTQEAFMMYLSLVGTEE